MGGPREVEVLARSLHPAEGAVWLVASAWLAMRLSAAFCPTRAEGIFKPSQFSVSFAFAFLHSALAPFSRLFGVSLPAQAGDLLGTLFVLTLVWALGSLVVRLQGSRAVEAREELHALEEKLLGIEKLVAVGTLAAGAAHDFNNVLTAILGVAQLGLQREDLSAQTREDLEDITSSARAAGVIAARLLGVARLGAGPVPHANLRDAVERPLDLLAKELARQGIEVVTRLEDAPPIHGDTRLVSQVCLNLFLNAPAPRRGRAHGSRRACALRAFSAAGGLVAAPRRAGCGFRR